MAYFEAVVGDAGPGSSAERRHAYLTFGPRMLTFLQNGGLRFKRCAGYPDYYDNREGGPSRYFGLAGLSSARPRPRTIFVDAAGERFGNEANSDVEVGKAMFARDKKVRAVPCWPLDRAPYQALPIFPACGGLVTDEHARVLGAEGEPMPRLYATGNITATVMGRTYLGAAGSIGSSMVFGFIAAEHACADAA